MKAWRIVLIIAGALLTADTLIVACLSNYNLGVILPAFFGVPLIGMGILLPWLQHGWPAVLKWIAVGLYGAVACIFIVCGILMADAAGRGRGADRPALVVLGAAVHGDRVTWVLSNRLDTAKEYLDAHPDAVAVVSGGQGAGESVTEASAMKGYLIARGVDPDRVIAEERAANTRENFRFSMELITARLGADTPVAFVTTGFHVYRAGKVAAAQGIDAVGVAAPDVWYIAVNNFMRECVGICVYALRGHI